MPVSFIGNLKTSESTKFIQRTKMYKIFKVTTDHRGKIFVLIQDSDFQILSFTKSLKLKITCTCTYGNASLQLLINMKKCAMFSK